MRFGPLIDDRDTGDAAEPVPRSSPPVGNKLFATPKPARLNKYAFDASATQLADWSEFGSLTTVSEFVVAPTEIKDDPDVNYLKLKPYIEAINYCNPLSPPPSPPPSPTLPFPLSACTSVYPALRMALEHAPSPIQDLSQLSEAQHARMEALVLGYCGWQ